MPNNKVVFNGETLLDTSGTTVSQSTMLDGTTAVDRYGNTVTGNIAKRTASNVTVSGRTVTTKAGYYESDQSKSVAQGSVNNPTASKGNVSNHSVTVTPSVTSTTGYITGSTKSGTGVTVTASELVSGSETLTENGTFDVTNLASVIVNVAGSGGGLPSGISAIARGNDTVTTAFTTSRRTVTHNLGVTPDLVMYFATANVASTNSMLLSIRSTLMNYRSGYTSHNLYHGNSTSTVSYNNTNSTTYGVSNMTATTFQIASISSSYYWRAGTYRWIAIKFT